MLRLAVFKEGSGLGQYSVEVRDGCVDGYHWFFPDPRQLKENQVQHIYFCRRGIHRSTVLIEKESWQTRRSNTGRFYTKCERLQERPMLREKAVRLYEQFSERLRQTKHGTRTIRTLFKKLERTFNKATVI